MSSSSSGTLANGDCYGPSISADGRFVVFSALASNLVSNDGNFSPDVFLHDRSTGQTTLASVDSNGVFGDSMSWYPAISGDGKVLAFTSFSTNLVQGDTNARFDVFVRDLQSGQTSLASAGPGGIQGDGDTGSVALSFDGRFVAFVSGASNLVAGDTNQAVDVFVHDRTTGQTTRVTVDSAGVEADGFSQDVSISFDGRFVCFTSSAGNLVANDTNLVDDVFVHDRQTGLTVRASVSSSGAEASSPSSHGMISADGRWVAFDCAAPELVAGDTNGFLDVFVHDLQTAQTSLASLDSSGQQGTSGSVGPAISADGRFVSFWSGSTNFAPGATAGTNVFLRDRQIGSTTLVSADPNGSGGDDSSFFSDISSDGRIIAFESNATNLVSGDTNARQDIFVHDLLGPHLPAFCFGDGSGSACPCGNSSTPGGGQGCLSSLGTGGVLSGAGAASITADGVSLVGAQMPGSFALYFQGTTSLAGGVGIAFGDGLRCVGGQIVRLGTKLNVGGTSTFPGPGDPSVSVRGNCQPGDFRTYQVWYRNAAPFCTISTFNLTNAVEITWGT